MKRIIEWLMSHFSTPLPIGMSEFTRWQDSILKLSKVPDNDSTRFTSAVLVMHLDPGQDRASKQYFVKRLNKAAANEIANAVCMKLKEDQKARALAEQETKLKEATNNDGALNGRVEQNG